GAGRPGPSRGRAGGPRGYGRRRRPRVSRGPRRRRRLRPPARTGGSRGVQRLVDEPVRELVVRPPDVAELDVLEPPRELVRFHEETAKRRILHAVLAAHL